MRGLLKIILLIGAIPVAIIGVLFSLASFYVYFKTEGRITVALESGFPDAKVSINDREDWNYANQICFDVTASPKSGEAAKREVVMIQGDQDGGTWALSRTKYDSMRECQKSFDRG